jgi:hypothetical protein
MGRQEQEQGGNALHYKIPFPFWEVALGNLQVTHTQGLQLGEWSKHSGGRDQEDHGAKPDQENSS